MLKRLTVKKSSLKTGTQEKKGSKRNIRFSSEEVGSLIQQKAFEVYCNRGSNPGDQTSDWLNAEKQVKKE
ncbi:DUF2934 domain-containing protein, partial [bacterium]|nr:DUF2934 domain-containing protein [bacterium]